MLLGEFSIRLHDVGTYYFSTGVIGKNQNVKLSGSIVVVAKEDRATDVVVSVGDIEAVQDTGMYFDNTKYSIVDKLNKYILFTIVNSLAS